MRCPLVLPSQRAQTARDNCLRSSFLSRCQLGQKPLHGDAVLALTTQLLSILSGDAQKMEPVRRMPVEFADFLPILKAWAGSLGEAQAAS